ncbi:hypothetical protein IO90_05975 [Chryseobacterium sp. FH1]|nr:hypothetical protein IO90_05975 [Chryseobacterium sp. FH1]
MKLKQKNERKNLSFYNYMLNYFFGGMGCPSSPPVPPGLGLGCGTDDVVVVPSFPQFEVFELGFEINPNSIKIKFNIVVKI